MIRPLLLASLLVACGTSDKPAAPPPPATPPPPQGSPTPAILSDAIRTKVCTAEPCGGDEPLIRIYRDGSGTVKKLYRLYGACSHSPGIYFDPDGTQAEVIPEKPIVPSSDEAREFQARHDKQVGGLTVTDQIRCSDGMRLPP